MKARGEGLKYDKDKVRWDLLQYKQLEKVADILTFGAAKYDDNNWQNLDNFKDRYLAAMMRHMNAFIAGEKNDPESGKTHLAHAATNLHFLMWGEDNLWNLHNLRLGLDIDGVLADFNTSVMEREGIESEVDWWKYDYRFNKNEFWEKLVADEDFWMNIKPLCKSEDIPIEPTCYITARQNKQVAEAWLQKNGFATKPVVAGANDKVKKIKEFKLDIFVDDKPQNYFDLKKAGIRVFLMDQSWNRRYDVGADRIYSLNDLKTIL